MIIKLKTGQKSRQITPNRYGIPMVTFQKGEEWAAIGMDINKKITVSCLNMPSIINSYSIILVLKYITSYLSILDEN